MKMYVDLTVEGTPEEVAAFKHIDAALASRNSRAAQREQRAIEGPRPAPKKVVSKRVVKKRKPGAGRPRESNEVYETIIGLAIAKGGITANEVAEYLEIPKKTAYNRLYHLHEKGILARSGGVFKASKAEVDSHTVSHE